MITTTRFKVEDKNGKCVQPCDSEELAVGLVAAMNQSANPARPFSVVRVETYTPVDQGTAATTPLDQ